MRLLRRSNRADRKPPTLNMRVGFMLFWLLVVAYAFFIPTGPSFNSESHLYTAFSVVDHGTVNIDHYRTRLGDIAYWNGHYYSDKAPGLALVAVPVYGALHLAFPSHLVGGYKAFYRYKYQINRNTAYFRYAITYVVIIIPMAIFCILFWLFLTRFAPSTRWALFLTVVYALGTTAYVYTSWFYSHQLCAVLLFSAFLLLFTQVRDRIADRRAYRLTAMAGLLAGYAVISEYPTALIAALLGVYLLVVARDRVRSALAFVAGAVPPALLAVGYNLLAFGKPFATGYMHVHSQQYHSNVHGGLFGLAAPSSYGVQAPSWNSLWQITFGAYRGIFLVSPVLLLFFAALLFMWKRRDMRAEWWLCVSVVGLYFLMDASRGVDQNGWSGGWSVASRHLVPMLPFMVFPMVFGLWNRAFRLALVVAGSVSMLLMLSIVAIGDTFNFADRNPLVNEVLRGVVHNSVIFNWGFFVGVFGLLTLVPFALVEGALAARIVWLFRTAGRERQTAPLPLAKLEAG